MISAIKKSRVESWNWPVKTESIVKHQIDRNLTEILFLGARGTFIWGEHSEGVTNAWDHTIAVSLMGHKNNTESVCYVHLHHNTKMAGVTQVLKDITNICCDRKLQ